MAIKRLTVGRAASIPAPSNTYTAESVQPAIKYPINLDDASANYDYYYGGGERKSMVIKNTVKGKSNSKELARWKV